MQHLRRFLGEIKGIANPTGSDHRQRLPVDGIRPGQGAATVVNFPVDLVEGTQEHVALPKPFEGQLARQTQVFLLRRSEGLVSRAQERREIVNRI